MDMSKQKADAAIDDGSEGIPVVPQDDADAIFDRMFDMNMQFGTRDQVKDEATDVVDPDLPKTVAPTETKENRDTPASIPVATDITPTTNAPTDAEINSARYWQSEADKKNNELEKLRVENQKLMETSTSNKEETIAPANQEADELVIEDFPAPPNEPVKPRGFNRLDAQSDGNSDSAQYIEDIEQWRNDMTKYNAIRVQWNYEVQKKKDDYREGKARRLEADRAAHTANTQRTAAITKTLKSQYGADDAQVEDFVKTMSSKESWTLDNLWNVYAIKKGIAVKQASNQVVQPSATFQQQRVAQHAPNPLSLMPGQAEIPVTTEDLVMKRLLSNSNENDPWAKP